MSFNKENNYNGVVYSDVSSCAGSILSLTKIKQYYISDDVINVDSSLWSGAAANSFENYYDEIQSRINVLDNNLSFVKSIVATSFELVQELESLDGLIDSYDYLSYNLAELKNSSDADNLVESKKSSLLAELEYAKKCYNEHLVECHSCIDKIRSLDSSFIEFNNSSNFSNSYFTNVIRSDANPYFFKEVDANGNTIAYYELNTIDFEGAKRVVPGLDFYIKYDVKKIKDAIDFKKCKFLDELEYFYANGENSNGKKFSLRAEGIPEYGVAMSQVVNDTLEYNELSNLSVSDKAAIIATIIANNSIYKFPYARNRTGKIEKGCFDCDTFINGCYNTASDCFVTVALTISDYLEKDRIGNLQVRKDLSVLDFPIKRGDIILRGGKGANTLHAAMIVGQFENDGELYYVVAQEGDKSTGAIISAYRAENWKEDWMKANKCNKMTLISGEDYDALRRDPTINSIEELVDAKNQMIEMEK